MHKNSNPNYTYSDQTKFASFQKHSCQAQILEPFRDTWADDIHSRLHSARRFSLLWVQLSIQADHTSLFNREKKTYALPAPAVRSTSSGIIKPVMCGIEHWAPFSHSQVPSNTIRKKIQKEKNQSISKEKISEEKLIIRLTRSDASYALTF